jgi:AcrR family transcriptional regulator
MPEQNPARARRATSGVRRGTARKRAIYDDEKEARRGQLLAAARQLFLERNGRLATVTEVANRAGVAKGTVYLYFQTKEELYVTHYEELMTALLERLPAVCAQEKRDVRARIVDAICDFVEVQPDFLRLGSLMNGVLEQNLSDDFIEAYKSRLGGALIATATELSLALAPLSFADAAQLFLRSYAISVGLWQQADLPGVVRKLLKRRPDLGFYQIDFAGELRSALTLLWQQPATPAAKP